MLPSPDASCVSAAFAVLAAPPTSAAVVTAPAEKAGAGLAGWYPASVPTPGATAAAEALVGDHLAPVIRSFREVGRITERLALGCVAASCAGVFARLHRRVPAEGRRPCGTCSDITAEERQRRTRRHATFAPRGNDLRVVAVDVA